MRTLECASPPAVGPVDCLWPAGAELGEGLCWSIPSQSLWWVDILGHRIHNCDAGGGQRRSWQLPDTVSALAEYSDGSGLLVALRHQLARFDPQGECCLPLVAATGEPAGNRFNDGKCDARGRFWVGTMDYDCTLPTGQLWCLEAGTLRLAFAAGYPVTNGPTWIDGGRTMLFSDTANRRVLAHDFDAAAGVPGPARLWYEFPEEDGYPDGMTTDAEGRVWIAHWGAGCVTAHDPHDARELLRVLLPTRNITNVAFGGAGLATLFISSAASGLDAAQRAAEPLAGGLFAVPTDVVGLPAQRYRG